jgi:hypothetical protein
VLLRIVREGITHYIHVEPVRETLYYIREALNSWSGYFVFFFSRDHKVRILYVRLLTRCEITGEQYVMIEKSQKCCCGLMR